MSHPQVRTIPRCWAGLCPAKELEEAVDELTVSEAGLVAIGALTIGACDACRRRAGEVRRSRRVAHSRSSGSCRGKSRTWAARDPATRLGIWSLGLYDHGVGFNRVTWTPGHDRKPIGASQFGQLARLRRQREARARDTAAAHALKGSLMSLAALLGSEVKDPDGRSAGRLSDVVVHWATREAYPTVRAVVVKNGKLEVVIGARWLEVVSPSAVRLRSSRAYASTFDRHSGDVALARDVLDRQVIDADGVQILRPSDIYLAAVGDRIELVGIEVGARALIRRLGPRRLRSRIRPARVIDWGSVSAFAPPRAGEARPHGRHTEIAGKAGTGLELGREAAEVKRLRPSEVQAALEDAIAKHTGEPS